MTETLNASEWLQRKQQLDATIEDVLPSGLQVVRKQHVTLESLVFSGHLPLTLVMELAQKHGSDSGAAGGDDGLVEIDLDELMKNIEMVDEVREYMGLVDAVFKAALISPRIGDTTDVENNVLALAEFEDYATDKIYVMEKVMSATDALRPFRAQANRNGAAAPPRERVRKPAKRTAKNSG